MKTIQEQIEVMQHFANGGKVKAIAKRVQDANWVKAPFPCWDWDNYDYCIEEQGKTIIIEKWLMKAGNRKSFFIANGDKSYFENYHTQTEKVKLLETYEVEL